MHGLVSRPDGRLTNPRLIDADFRVRRMTGVGIIVTQCGEYRAFLRLHDLRHSEPPGQAECRLGGVFG